jgi:hypothetical protein
MDPGRHHGEYKICHESRRGTKVDRKSHSIISNLIACAPLPKSCKAKIRKLVHCCPQLSQPIVAEKILFAVSPLLKIAPW